MSHTWPPTLTDLKTDMKVKTGEGGPTLDDQLDQVLDAAVAFVQRVRPGYRYDPTILFAADGTLLPLPSDDLWLGTMRLAARWHARRRSQDGMIAVSAEMGSARIPSFDADIERLLGIGRFAKPVIA